MAVRMVERGGPALEAGLTPEGNFADSEYSHALEHFGSEAEVEGLLRKLIHPNVAPGPMLSAQIIDMERAKNGGFPCWMHHATMKPREVFNMSQQEALMKGGFSRNYITHDYPQHVFRRNFSPKFQLSDPMTGAPGEFVEMRLVRTAAEKEKLARSNAQPNCGRWVNQLVEVEYPKKVLRQDGKEVLVQSRDQEDKILAYTEDPELKVSRLEGQLEEARRAAAAGTEKTKR